MDDSLRLTLGKKISKIVLVVNFSLMLSKALVGYFAGSTAIIADAFNNGTDIFAAIAVFGGMRIAYKPPDDNHNYGHEKAEPIVTKIVALIIMFTGVAIGWSALKQIISRSAENPGYLAILISFASIFIKYFLFKYTNRMGKLIESSSIIADSYNHRSDILASSAVLVGVAGARFGIPILDPIAGILVSIVIFKTGITIYIEAISALMDTAPSVEVINNIRHSVLQTKGVIKVNDIRARKYGFRYHVDLKICVDKDISVQKGHDIASNTKQNIISNLSKVQDVMIHVNPCPNSVNENNKISEN